MYLGRIVEEGPAEAVFTQPLHPYTAALVAAIPEIDPDKPLPKDLLGASRPVP
jgi:peptide/nickel transport system ATP-binding protein